MRLDRTHLPFCELYHGAISPSCAALDQGRGTIWASSQRTPGWTSRTPTLVRRSPAPASSQTVRRRCLRQPLELRPHLYQVHECVTVPHRGGADDDSVGPRFSFL